MTKNQLQLIKLVSINKNQLQSLKIRVSISKNQLQSFKTSCEQ